MPGLDGWPGLELHSADLCLLLIANGLILAWALVADHIQPANLLAGERSIVLHPVNAI